MDNNDNSEIFIRFNEKLPELSFRPVDNTGEYYKLTIDEIILLAEKRSADQMVQSLTEILRNDFTLNIQTRQRLTEIMQSNTQKFQDSSEKLQDLYEPYTL